MAYRATPLEKGLASDLLMGRRINTTLPVAKSQLQPYSVNKKILEAKEEKRIEGQKRNYDLHHGVRNLDELDPDQKVRISDRRTTGKILEKMPCLRSYLVESGKRSPKTLSKRASSCTKPSSNPMSPEVVGLSDLPRN